MLLSDGAGGPGDGKDGKLHLLLEKSGGKSVCFFFFISFQTSGSVGVQCFQSSFFISASQQTFRDEEEGEWEGQTGSKDFPHWIKKRKVSGLAASRTQLGVAGLTG